MPDDLSEYMTLAEFARLPADAHHTVWRARHEGRVDSVPAARRSPAGIRRFHRAQVTALLAEAAVNRGR